MHGWADTGVCACRRCEFFLLTVYCGRWCRDRSRHRGGRARVCSGYETVQLDCRRRRPCGRAVARVMCVRARERRGWGRWEQQNTWPRGRVPEPTEPRWKTCAAAAAAVVGWTRIILFDDDDDDGRRRRSIVVVVFRAHPPPARPSGRFAKTADDGVFYRARAGYTRKYTPRDPPSSRRRPLPSRVFRVYPRQNRPPVRRKPRYAARYHYCFRQFRHIATIVMNLPGAPPFSG